MISVLTYNILEESLALPSLFAVSDSSHLDTEVRIPKIVRELKQAFSDRSIIALQEVGVGMAARLHSHFIENGYYTVVAHSFMGKGRNFQGVLLAFPLDKYKYISYSQVKLGSLVLEPEGMIDLSMNPRDEKQNAFQYASGGDQCLLHLTLELKETGRRFTIITCHLPFVNGWPAVTTLHTEAVCKKVRELSIEGPCILLGDTNFTPEYSAYRQVVGIEGEMNLPASNYKLEINKLVDCCMREAPTTRALSPQGRDFCERLDYIFHTEGLTCVEYKCGEIASPMPNEEHGSDHLPVSAVLRLE